MHSGSGTLATQWLLVALLVLMAALSWKLIGNLRTHQQLVQDRAELRHVKYGMLNADQWVAQVTVIVEKKVRELEIRGEQRESMKRALERILDTLITETDRYIREQHSSGDWWDRTTGRIKEGLRNVAMDIETVKAGIPQYAEQILVELENSDTRQEIGDFLSGILGDVASSTFAQVDDRLREAIHQRYQCADNTGCKQAIGSTLAAVDRQSRYLAGGVLLCAVLMLLAVRRTAEPSHPLPWVLLSLSAMLLLACGVLTPMLEVEAQISQLRFMLMGHPVEFFNEVIYFQSKSILDVVSILTSTRKADMVLVGLLLMTFSVIFPSLKLLASVVVIYNPGGLRQSAPVRFFAFKSGKWSMADVMVIAIFMAYIGFNGMIGSQLDLITRGAASAGVDVLTTNGTSLQPGFFMFLAFCVFSLVVSTIMESALEHGDQQGRMGP
jgi:hypothetical protein